MFSVVIGRGKVATSVAIVESLVKISVEVDWGNKDEVTRGVQTY